MKGFTKIALGIVTSIGGFLEIGSLATSSQAGAAFRFSLLWTVALGTICLIFLIEMTGRLSAVSQHPIADAVRERFGLKFIIVPRLAELIVNFLLLGAEIGGVCFALYLVTGISMRWFALPVALLIWIGLWLGSLDWIENTTSFLGLVTICFLVAAWKLHPAPADILRGLIPRRPQSDSAHYWFVAISILGATISPYMFHFYGSGAVEDKWSLKDLGANRLVAIVGTSFGALITVGVLITSAMVFHPRGIRLDMYEQISLMLTQPFGRAGFYLFAGSLAVGCFGAAAEIALGNAYMISQTLGWNWGEDLAPGDEARFSLTYTVFIFASSLLILAGLDPLKLTLTTMALTALILPPVVFPFLLLLNDRDYVGQHRNGWIGNGVVMIVIVLSFVLAIVTIPLEIVGG